MYCSGWALRPPEVASCRHGPAHQQGLWLIPASLRTRDCPRGLLVAKAAGDASSSSVSGMEATRTVSSGRDVDARTRARRRTTQHVQPNQIPSRTAVSDGGISPMAVALAAVAGLGVLAVMYKKFFSNVTSQAKTVVETLPQTVAQGIQQKRLQRDAQGRLNEMCDQLRTLPSVDLSAKNLGDEGTAYVVEALAFNTACRALDLSKNGIGIGAAGPPGTAGSAAGAAAAAASSSSSAGGAGAGEASIPGGVGVAALLQVLPSCVLDTLVLNTNSLGDAGAEVLAGAVAAHPHLTTLDLGQNGIGDAGATALAEALRLNTRLKRLDLSGNAIDQEGAAALAAALAANNTLEVLVLTDNYLGEAGALALADALRSNSSLQQLHLKGNAMGDAGVAAICEALMSHPGEVRVLDLGNNGLTGGGAAALTRLLGLKRSLRELNLYMNDIGDAGVAKMAHAIADNKGLTVLDLGANDIGPTGVAALAAALRNHGSLTSIELGYNPLGAEGTRTIADLAKFGLPKLSTLKLGWCKVAGGDGARALSDLLLLNSTLTHLDLRGNVLGNDGAILLSRGLKAAENSKLAELDLGYNEIKDDGACALAQALKANPEGAPRELKLNSNYITRFGQVALSEAVDMVYDMGKAKVITVHF